MYYFIHFELTLKQMGKKLKVSLKQFHGYLYAVIILQFCKHTVLSTSYGAGTNISAYVLTNRILFYIKEFFAGKVPLLWGV